MQFPFHRFSHSIVTRLLVVGLLVVISGSLLRYFLLTTWLREDLEQLISGERLAIANFVASAIDYKLVERQTLLERMANSLPPETIDNVEQLRSGLRQRHELLPLFSKGFVVLDRDGVAIADYPSEPGRIGRRYGGDAVFEEARNGKRGATMPVIDADTKQPTVSMAAPIRDRSGEVRGMLVGIDSLSALDLLNIPQQSIGGSGGLLLVSSKDNLFVSSTDPSMTLQSTPARGVNPLHDRAMDGYRGTGITVNARGVEELSAMVSVVNADWFVVARIPTAEAFAAIARTRISVLHGSLLSLVLMIVLVAGLSWWSLKPLFVAAREADAMTRGDAPLQPLPVARDDEVGHLTAAFNRLLSKLTNSQEELLRMAHHDSLTGLPNRRLLADRLRQALARSRRNGGHVALLMMDLDGFKPINDAHGHEAGDEALRATGKRFASALRRDDTLARVGGDEFVMLATDLPGTANDVSKAAQAIATKCIAIASQPLVIDGATTCLGVSIGIAICDGDCSPDQILNAADQAMYEAKQTGRGRHVLAKPIAAPVREVPRQRRA
jgi:diguanylate cyclase (GGDEF)-like protein